ncbi:hypothetical protein VNO77_26744 [Canavalia gladiata]|uniref:Uncharacterized protein n=1 Tax=Canavalia gladiata TaxID=3824 RepID=A0AAN9KTL4_CANGL
MLYTILFFRSDKLLVDIVFDLEPLEQSTQHFRGPFLRNQLQQPLLFAKNFRASASPYSESLLLFPFLLPFVQKRENASPTPLSNSWLD